MVQQVDICAAAVGVIDIPQHIQVKPNIQKMAM